MASARPTAGSGAPFRLPPPGAILPLLGLLFALDAYCLVDLARAPSARGAPKIVWAIIILFVSAPFGALLYLFLGRDRDGGRPDPPARARGLQVAPRPAQPDPGEEHGASPAGAAPTPADRPPLVTTSGLSRDYGC